MRRNALVSFGVVAVFVLVAPAWAQEVVYFTNGSTMAIESHTVEKGMVRVKLEGQSEMAFPLDQVEKIESAGGATSTAGPANKILPGAAVVTGEMPPHLRRGSWKGSINEDSADPRIGVDAKGVTVYRPFGSEAPPNRRQFAVSGQRGLTAPGRSVSGVVGANQAGTRQVLPSTPGGGPRMPVGLTARPAAAQQGGGNATGNTGSTGNTDGTGDSGGSSDTAGGEND